MAVASIPSIGRCGLPAVLEAPDASAEIDDFLHSLRGALKAARPVDMGDFVRKICCQQLVVSGLSPSEQASLLCRAAALGDPVELDSLLKQGLQPNMADYDLRTPLHLAAEEMHAPCVELLLASRADVNAADRWGSTPLAGVEALIAVGEDGGRGEAVAELLRQAGGGLREEYYLFDGDCTPCERAWGLSHAPPPSMEEPRENAAERCLLRAAAEGKAGKIRRMLDDGSATVNSANCDGRRPIHLASENGHLEVVRLLIERRADVDAKDNWGTTPLSGAERNSHFNIADLLEDHGAKRSPPRARPLEHHAAVARRWWDERLCREAGQPPSSERVPGEALRRVLQRDFGFDLGRHAVLEAEVRRLEEATGGEDGTPTVARAHFMRAALASCRAERARERSPTSPPARGTAPRPARPLRSVRSWRSALGGQHVPRCDSAGSSLPWADEETDGGRLDEEEEEAEAEDSILSRIVLGKLAIGNWESFVEIVRGVFAEVAADASLAEGPLAGANADYIPQLRDAPSDRIAIAICTVDGQTCGFGACEEFYSVQSTGKSFAYTLAMKEHTKAHNPKHEGPEGKAYVHQFVGQEPSGRAFNDFALTRPDANGIEHPFNPVTNAGAIVTCSMIDEHNPLPVKPGDARSERMESRLSKYKGFLSELCGGEELGDCMDIFESERSEAFNNYALANFMRARGTFPPSVRCHDQLRESVDFYLRVCATRVNTRLLASAAATYATFGTCPLSGRAVMAATEAKQTLAILSACGMYDFSGEWACTVGLPAKSGVSGNIFIVVPGMFGLCVWSPRLDAMGNSVRGVRMAQLLKEHMSCSLLDIIARSRY